MQIIAPVNNKGGVGKTKVTTLIAEYFAKYANKRVLAIDFDPQCNFSQRYLQMEIDPSSPEGVIPPIHPEYDPQDPDNDNWDGRSSIADIFFGEPVVPYPTPIKNLDILPGHASKLLSAEAVRKSEVVDKIYNQLAYFLSDKELQDRYDIVVVDTAPSKGPLTISVVKAATHIVIPSIMEVQPIQGIYGMLQLWKQEALSRSKDNPLELIGILPNMFKNTTLHQNLLASLLENESIGRYVMPMKIGHRIIFAEVDSDEASPKSVFDLTESNPARKEVMAMCEYIETRIEQ